MAENPFVDIIDSKREADVKSNVETAAVSKGNPFLPLIDQKRESDSVMFNTAMQEARDTDPDQYAKQDQLSKRTGIPVDVVQRNQDKVEKQAPFLSGEYDRLRESHPGTAGFLAEEDNAKWAKDDVENLSVVEQIAKMNADPHLLEMIGRSAMYGVNQIDQSLMQTPALVYNAGAALYNLAAIPQNLVADQFGFESLRAPEAGTAPDWLLNNPLAEYYRKAAESYAPEEIYMDPIELMKEGNGKQAARTIAAQVVANLPQQIFIVGATLMGQPQVGLAGMGVLSASNATAEAQANGKSALMTTLDAFTQGGIEVATEASPIGTVGILKHWEGALLKSFGKGTAKQVITDAGKAIASAFFGEGFEEIVASIGQDISDYATGNPEALDGYVQRALNAFLIGSFSGGLVTAPSVITSSAVKSMKASQDGKFWDEAMGASGQSKLRQRSPQKYEQFLNRVTKENGKPQNLYVSHDALRTFFQDENGNVNEPEFQKFIEDMEIKDQLAEAAATGKEFEMSAAKFAAKFAGSDLSQALRPDIRFDPDGMTQREQAQLQQEYARMVQEMQQEYTELVEQQKLPPELQSIRDKMLLPKDVGGAAMSAEDADSQLKVLASGLMTFARRAGIPFEEYVKQVNPVLNVGGQFIQGSDALTQGEDPEVFNLYHGTDVDFENFDLSKTGKNTDTGMYGKGFYFTDDKTYAKTYARKTGGVKQVSVRLRNPYVINTKEDIPDVKVPEETMEDLKNSPVAYSEKFTELLKSQGYDGVISKISKPFQYVAFDPSQVEEVGKNQFFQDQPGFEKFFEGSKVVNEDGSPKVVYHATKSDFTSFEKGDIGFHFGDAAQAKSRTRFLRDKKRGVKQTKEEARQKSVGVNVKPVYLSLKNPLRTPDVGAWHHADSIVEAFIRYVKNGKIDGLDLDELQQLQTDVKEVNDGFVTSEAGMDLIRNFLAAKGYDGIVYKNKYEAKHRNTDSYIAFDPGQIKSAIGNRGTFDPDNPNILFQTEAESEGDNEFTVPTAKVNWSKVNTFMKKKGYDFRGAKDAEELFNRRVIKNGKINANVFPDHVAAIEYATNVKQQTLETKAKRFFGTTRYFEEAGYLLPDGTMLDFSGRKDGYQGPPARNSDHREINQVIDYENDPELKKVFEDPNTSYSAGMIHFMNRGNIRMQQDGVELTKAPTPQQLRIIAQHVRVNKGESYAVDFADEKGNVVESKAYEYPNVNPSKVLADINAYFGKGESVRTFFQPAYHGSPHLFDKFDLQKIGTGQGAQTYGWGIYFAGNREVAEFYKTELRPPTEIVDWRVGSISLYKNGQPQDYSPRESTDNAVGRAVLTENMFIDIEQDVIEAFDSSGLAGVKKVIADYIDSEIKRYEEEHPPYVPIFKAIRKALEEGRFVFNAKPGTSRLYEVDIPEDSEYLDWDKSAAEQSEKVKKVIEEEKLTEGDYIKTVGLLGVETGGAAIYLALAHKLGSEEAASRFLASKGIAGIRYLDQFSRHGQIRDDGKFIKSSNYVVFDDALIKIRDFEQTTPGGATPRGSVQFTDTQTIINLYNSANLSTFLHETGHVFMNEMQKMVEAGVADEQMQKDFQTLTDFVGGDINSREAQEKLARGFEAYLREGKAPSVKLAAAFSRFRDWLTAIYRSIRGLNVEINDEVRGVFDRVLASENEIEEAKQFYRAKKTLVDLIPVTQAQRQKVTKAKADSDEEALRKTIKERLNIYLRLQGGKAAIRDQATKEIDGSPVYQAIKEAVDVGGLDARLIEQIYGKETVQLLRANHPGVVKQQSKSKKGRTYYAEVLSYGGIKPSSMEPDERRFFKQNGLFGLFRKDGQGLDEIAQEMQSTGILQVPDNYNPGDYLKQLLEEKAELPSDEVLIPDQAVTLAELAAAYNFESEDAVIEAMKKADRRSRAITTRAQQILQQKEQDLLRDLKSGEQVPGDEALHNDKSLTFLITEASIIADKLAKAKNRRPERVEEKLYRAAADEVIGKKSVRLATRYDLYARAEQRFAKQAEDALINNDFEAALLAKKKQLLNHAMVQSAIKAREEKLKIENYFKAKNYKNKLNRTENDFAEAAMDVTSTYGLGTAKDLLPKSQEALKKVYDADEILAAQIPDWILNKQKPANFKDYRDLSMNNFRQLNGAVRSILQYGSDAMKSAEEGEAQTRQEWIDASVSEMEKLKERKDAKLNELRQDTRRTSRAIDLMDGFTSGATMVQFLSDWMDGFKFMNKGTFGPFRTLYNKVLKAETQYHEHRERVLNASKPAWDLLGKATDRLRKQYGRKIEIEGLPVPEDLQRTNRKYWTANRLIGILLNTGNEGNMTALQRGYGFTPEQIQKVASFFTAEELQAIQTIWDSADLLFPELDETHFSIYNRHTGKVDPQPISFTSLDGQQVDLKGGYHPLIFDHKINDRAAEHFEADMMKNQTQAVIRSSKPEDGMTYARKPGHSLPPLLDASIWFTHVNNTARYISHARILRDLNLITRDKKWAAELKKRAGEDHYKSLRSWLQYNANPTKKAYLNNLDRKSSWLADLLRSTSTAAILGLKNAVGIKQRASMINAAQAMGKEKTRNGWKWIMKAYGEVDWRTSAIGIENTKAWADIIAQSAYMKTRDGRIDREISDMRRGLDPIPHKVKILNKEFQAKDIQDFAFFWIKMNDRAAVSIVWTAAYNQFIAEKADPAMAPAAQHKAAIAYADGLVQDTQPSSLATELSELQRAEGWLRLFTSFMTYTLKYGNRVMQHYRAWNEGAISNKEFFKHVMQEQVGQAYVAMMITSVMTGGDLPEWWEFLLEPFAMLVSWIPLIRDVASYYKYGSEIGRTPLAEAPTRFAKAAAAPFRFIVGDQEFTQALWDIGRAIEVAYKVPVLNTVKEIQKVYENLTD